MRGQGELICEALFYSEKNAGSFPEPARRGGAHRTRAQRIMTFSLDFSTYRPTAAGTMKVSL